MRRRLRAHGGQALQIGEQGVRIGARHAGVAVIREGRIQQAPTTRAPVVQRTPEVLRRPQPQARLLVGGEIAGVQRAERGGQAPPARIFGTARRRVAASAVAYPRKVGAALDQGGLCFGRS